MLWLTYAMRNAMICGGWDPQVSQTTRKCSAFLSWILVVRACVRVCARASPRLRRVR